MYRVGVLKGVIKRNTSAGKQGHRKKRPEAK
jgi:hypothetical protein